MRPRSADFVITTKLDGTSATFYRSPEGELIACSRNWSLMRGSNHSWRLAERLDLESRLPPGLAVQGELCGPGIQKNRLGLMSVELLVFNVLDTRVRGYMNHADVRAFCEAHGLQAVPVEAIVTGDAAATFEHSLDRYHELARGVYVGTSNRREGIVVRPLAEAHSPTLGGRLSFKVINNDFLLKDED